MLDSRSIRRSAEAVSSYRNGFLCALFELQVPWHLLLRFTVSWLVRCAAHSSTESNDKQAATEPVKNLTAFGASLITLNRGCTLTQCALVVLCYPLELSLLGLLMHSDLDCYKANLD